VETEAPSKAWHVISSGYSYSLSDATGQEIIAYHWHPGGRSPIGFPHLHIEAGAHVRNPQVARAHLPTGRILLEEVLRLTIREFGVQTLHDDWEQIFTESQLAYETP
jgi:hypothetical protein